MRFAFVDCRGLLYMANHRIEEKFQRKTIASPRLNDEFMAKRRASLPAWENATVEFGNMQHLGQGADGRPREFPTVCVTGV